MGDFFIWPMTLSSVENSNPLTITVDEVEIGEFVGVASGFGVRFWPFRFERAGYQVGTEIAARKNEQNSEHSRRNRAQKRRNNLVTLEYCLILGHNLDKIGAPVMRGKNKEWQKKVRKKNGNFYKDFTA